MLSKLNIFKEILQKISDNMQKCLTTICLKQMSYILIDFFYSNANVGHTDHICGH